MGRSRYVTTPVGKLMGCLVEESSNRAFTIIKRKPGITVPQLASAMGVTYQAAHSIVNKFIKANLVTCEKVRNTRKLTVNFEAFRSLLTYANNMMLAAPDEQKIVNFKHYKKSA